MKKQFDGGASVVVVSDLEGGRAASVEHVHGGDVLPLGVLGVYDYVADLVL